MPKPPRHRLRIAPHWIVRGYIVLDWLAVAFAAEFASRWGAGVGVLELPLGQAGVFVLAACALKAGLWATDFYHTPPTQMRAGQGAGGLALGAVAGLLIGNIFAVDAASAAALSASLPCVAMLLAGVHAAFALWVRAAHRNGAFSETVVIIGATEAARRVVKASARTNEARVIAIIDDRISRTPARFAGAPVSGGIGDLLRWDGLGHVDRVVIALPHAAEARVRAVVEQLQGLPNRIDLAINVDGASADGPHGSRLCASALICVAQGPKRAALCIAKRALDIAVSALTLAFLAPALATIALVLRAESEAPLLHRQRCHGLNNRTITIFKFRTRIDGEPTSIGQLLRSAGFDALPMLFNVLRGDLSLVGPRPMAAEAKIGQRRLGEIETRYAHRHRVKPGLISLAQINGAPWPLRTASDARQRLKYDFDYAEHASLWLDLRIIARAMTAMFHSAPISGRAAISDA